LIRNFKDDWPVILPASQLHLRFFNGGKDTMENLEFERGKIIARVAIALLFLWGMAGGASAQTMPDIPGASRVVYGPFGTPGIGLKPFTMNPRQTADSLVDVSFLLDAPAGKEGFVRAEGGHLIKGDGTPIRLWGFDLTEWSPGSMEIPPKVDAPIYAAALARFGVNYVRLHFLDLPSPRGMIDGKRNDSQHFDLAQLDNEDFFISEMLKRGIYIDMNLNVGRQFKPGDGVLSTRVGKGPLLFDKRLIELEKDYAKQLLTHVNPYTHRAYADEPGMAIVEMVNEDAIYVGWTSNNAYNQELTDLYNDWLKVNRTPEQLAKLRELAGVGADQPMLRLRGRGANTAPKEQYYAECEFFTGLESGFFKDMQKYLTKDLGVKCPIIATSDHAHAGSSYALLKDTSQLDVLDGHTYWQHPGERPKNAPMVNDPLNSTVVELSRTAFVDKPFTCSEVNHPFPNQYACEGIPILAAYAGFQGWDGIVWYSFEQKKDPNWQPYVGDPFDMSLDPVKMPQMAAGALMFVRGDLDAAKETVERSYTTQEVWDSRFLARTERPYFTPGFPQLTPLLHGSRIKSLDGNATATVSQDSSSPLKSDTGQLVWYTSPADDPTPTGLVTIDSPRSQGLIGFVKVNDKRVTNLAADVKNDFCAIVVNSLEDRPIASCGRMLLTACVRVENTDMKWDATRTHSSRQGHSPSLIEPVKGQIILRSLDSATAVSATPLDGSGKALGEAIAAAKTMRGWEIPVGDPATTWYLVTVSR
jgi:hypothetical protein